MPMTLREGYNTIMGFIRKIFFHSPILVKIILFVISTKALYPEINRCRSSVLKIASNIFMSARIGKNDPISTKLTIVLGCLNSFFADKNPESLNRQAKAINKRIT